MEYFKKIEVFLKKKHLSSDSLEITSSVFPDFQKCFLKFVKHFIFIPKTLKSVFKGRNTFKITAKRALILICCYKSDEKEIIPFTILIINIIDSKWKT